MPVGAIIAGVTQLVGIGAQQVNQGKNTYQSTYTFDTHESRDRSGLYLIVGVVAAILVVGLMILYTQKSPSK